MTKNTFDYFISDQINQFFNDVDVVIFDLNGLIVDDEPLQLQATNSALEAYGVTVSEIEWIEKCVGRRPHDYMQSFLKEILDKTVLDSLIETRGSIYRQNIIHDAKAVIRIGIQTLLSYLSSHGIEVALATSASRSGAFAVLGPESLGISNFFSEIVCGDEVTNAKPNPECYLVIRDRLGDTKTYIVLEDSAIGIQAAKRAGMKCMAVPNRFTARQNLGLADLIVSDLSPTAMIK